MKYLPVNVLLDPKYGQPSCNVLSDYTRVLIEHTNGFIDEAEANLLEAAGEAVVLVEGKAGDRIHLRPRNNDRWLSFGGTFAYSSDSRFREKYERPVHIHDRFEG